MLKEELETMKKQRIFLFTAIFLFAIAIILNFPFPDKAPFGTRIFEWLGIPPYSNMETETGFHFVGLTAMLLLLISLVFFNHFLPKWNGRVVAICIAFFLFGPMLLLHFYQSVFATGIHAISYEKEWSECDYELLEEKMVAEIECIIPLHYKGTKETTFEIELVERFHRPDDVKTYSYLNEQGPHIVEIYGKQKKMVRITGEIDLSKEKHYYISSYSGGIDIILRDEAGAEREL